MISIYPKLGKIDNASDMQLLTDTKNKITSKSVKKMIPKNDTEKWMAITQHALECLREAGNQWHDSQIFCFLIIPSFSSATSYSFCVRNAPLDGTSFYCVRTTWDKRYDGERFESSLRTKANLNPTLDTVLVKLDDAFARSIHEQIQEISVPLLVQCGIQLDGTQYEFSNRQVTLKWNDSFPKEWMSLVQITQRFVQCVDELVEDSEHE